MRTTVLSIALAVALSTLGSSAHALCIYKGELYAQPTVSQEFQDSRWVVKAKVLAATDHFVEGEDPWTEYQLEVQHAYKGSPPERLRFFTFRNSGGFYLDRGPEHDVGGEYLLFLNPTTISPAIPAAVGGTVSVNYSCGVSGLWSSVTSGARTELLRLRSASSSVTAQTVRSGTELLAASERSFSPIPFGASEPAPGLTRIIRDNCERWGECSYYDAERVEHYFWEGELVVKSVRVAEVGVKPIDALGIGTARSLDEVVERVRTFLPEAEIECESVADGTSTCGATLGEGWISVIFDDSRRLTEVRIDARHFT